MLVTRTEPPSICSSIPKVEILNKIELEVELELNYSKEIN